MATPVITNVQPASGPTSGGNHVRITGLGFGPRVSVDMGGPCQVIALTVEADGTSIVEVRTPVHAEGSVDVHLQNLDSAGEPIPHETRLFAGAYRFLRPRLAREPDLTRLVRTVIRELKRQVIGNVILTTSVDYDDGESTGRAIVLAALPALAVTGPLLRENRSYATNVPMVDRVETAQGVELRRRRPAYTADLEFHLTASSDRTTELLSLMAAVATFLNRNRWIEMLRDPENPTMGVVRWELDALGDFRLSLDGAGDDVRAFTCGFVVRGFDVDEGLPIDASRTMESPQLDTEALNPGGEV